jgi:hypothetical protein
METMSDTNEERLLTDLLREVAEADASLLPSSDLEQRVLSRWDRSLLLTSTRLSPRVKVALALAASAMLVVAGSMRSAPTPVMNESHVVDVVTPPPQASADAVESTPVMAPAKTARRRPAPLRRQSVDFVPLLPMTPGELSGSFQIVRVQMPRAALGALAGTTDMRRVQDPVMADVLLGEDGMARAIRVSTDGTAPWRIR